MKALKTLLETIATQSAFVVPVRRLMSLRRRQKRVFWIVADLLLLFATLWLLMAAWNGFQLSSSTTSGLFGIASAPLFSVAALYYLDLYRIVTRFIGREALARIAIGLVLSAIFWSIVVGATLGPPIPWLVLFAYPVVGALVVSGSRLITQVLIGLDPGALPKPLGPRRTVIIFGVSEAGVQLARALDRLGEFEIVGFSDEQREFWGKYAAGYKIFRADRLDAIVKLRRVRDVFLTPRQNTKAERARIVHLLQHLPVAFRALPAIEDIALGSVKVSDLNFIDAGDLLGRDPVPPIPKLISRSITGRSVMITGAGGSIGSELVRQVVRQKPARLVLVEMSEHALYRIHTEIEALIAEMVSNESGSDTTDGAPAVVAVLGSVLNHPLIERVIVENGVKTIYHAAAHKHVPIVEHNPIEGVKNNTFGTIRVAEVAQRNGVDQFVFISTDKAVRPTSVMGASKRCAELALQAMAARKLGQTIFSIVRFGNVIDSSGSVVRLFRKQIETGGPLTVTDRDMVRYFMSIPEAASLVIQAGAMAIGGEVFVLDMGEPIRIEDLARSMVRLSGLTVKDAENPLGDIEIKYTGLRVGEKMHEELFLNADTYATEHARIICAREPRVDAARLASELKDLQDAISQMDETLLRAHLFRIVQASP